jgi:hypothetical protein
MRAKGQDKNADDFARKYQTLGGTSRYELNATREMTEQRIETQNQTFLKSFR